MLLTTKILLSFLKQTGEINLHPSDPTNALRFLSIDAVQKANSGHPGMPMGMAEIATSLWSNHLKHNPQTLNGLIEIGLCCQTDMARCFYTAYFI